MRALDLCSDKVQLEVIAAIPDIVCDSEHGSVVESLKGLLDRKGISISNFKFSNLYFLSHNPPFGDLDV